MLLIAIVTYLSFSLCKADESSNPIFDRRTATMNAYDNEVLVLGKYSSEVEEDEEEELLLPPRNSAAESGLVSCCNEHCLFLCVFLHRPSSYAHSLFLLELFSIDNVDC